MTESGSRPPGGTQHFEGTQGLYGKINLCNLPNYTFDLGIGLYHLHFKSERNDQQRNL